MALGTITNLPLAQGGVADSIGSVKMTVTTVVGDGAYSAGGSTLTGQQLGLPNGVVLGAVCFCTAGAAASAAYNLSTGKLQAFQGSGTTPTIGLAENTTANLSGQTFTVIAFGY